MSAHLTAELDYETQLYLDNSTQSHSKTTHHTTNQSEILIRIPVKLPAYLSEYLSHEHTCQTGSLPVRLPVTYQNICYTIILPLCLSV